MKLSRLLLLALGIVTAAALSAGPSPQFVTKPAVSKPAPSQSTAPTPACGCAGGACHQG